MKKTSLLTACLIVAAIMVKAQTETPPPPPPPKPPKVELTHFNPPTKDLAAFYKQNPSVARLYWKSEKDIVVIHKDKSRFEYNMKDELQEARFKEKYGKVEITPPPPPPPLPKIKTQKMK